MITNLMNRFLVVLLVLLAACSPKREFHEKILYTGRMDTQQNFQFEFIPKHDDVYKIMMNYLIRDQNDRTIVFHYIKSVNEEPQIPTTATVRILDENGKEIVNNVTYLRRFSFGSSHNLNYREEVSCQLSGLRMEKDKTYFIQVQFENMDGYPLKEIDTSISVGIGGRRFK